VAREGALHKARAGVPGGGGVSACEKCWRDAHRSDDVAAEYTRLITERKANPCTPEEQAGDYATECPKCRRRSVHQHTGECMTFDCDYDEQRWKR
jgi:hypothetical protein